MTCQKCGEETDEVHVVTVGRKKRKVCEECYELLQEESEIATEAEGAMQGMMEYKGR